MRLRNGVLSVLGVTSLVAAALVPVSSDAGPWRRLTSVEKLATEIDRLECHIECYGTVVAKQPDVWGQSRLTKYRQDFEYIMAQRLDKFQETINASIARSDQAFLASALALQSAASGAPAPPNAGTMIGDPNAPNQNIITRTAPFQIKGSGTQAPGVALEPTVVLDQAARYLDHLNELRRVNDGDDTADSPGYGLHLIRIPISVLPGKKTTDGYGAEVTVSIQPYLSDELLPSTYRNLVVNDVIDLLGLGITKVLNEVPPDELNEIGDLLRDLNTEGKTPNAQEGLLQSEDRYQPLKKFDQMAIDRVAIQRFQSNVWQRRSRQSLSSTQMSDVFGSSGIVLGHVVVDANRTLRNQTQSDRIHLPDVEGFLKSELEAAYDFLSQPETLPLWERHCTQQLASAIRLRNRAHGRESATAPATIQALRDAFFDDIKQNYPGAAHTTTASLTWAILVESTLLNERLVEDIRETSTATNCQCVITDWMPFYLPRPTPEACLAFNQYVRCRWPIHVFALDPVTQDQNVADSFSRRREMQLALSLAFAGGQIGANSFTRFARRLELDMETIALNRTMVGFSHGNETFGWRFYPRVQTPPTDSNLTVVFRDLLVGGPSRNADLRTHRLEPGIRECVALVVMPAFVPYVVMDVRSNWFSLVNPQKKLLNLRDAATLSESVQSLHACTDACMEDAARYRDGDVHRLLKAAEQLEARLPLQSTYVQVPFENTLGGFEMFNTGVTDLAPELHGFYGEPGVTQHQATELFLVGDHFNVHETKVIAGTKLATSELLSRQVMRITISGDAKVSNGHVDVQVATPYGVSKPLSIPVVEGPCPPPKPPTPPAPTPDPGKDKQANRYSWSSPAIEASAAYDGDGRLAQMSIEPTSITVLDHSDIPFPVNDVELACWVNVKKKDGTATRIPDLIVGPIRGAFAGGRMTFSNSTSPDPLSEAVLQALKKDPKNLTFLEGEGVVALELEGFLRTSEGGLSSNRQAVARVENTLTVQLTPTALSTAAETPFDAVPREESRSAGVRPPGPASQESRNRNPVIPRTITHPTSSRALPEVGTHPHNPSASAGPRDVRFNVTASKPTEHLPAPLTRTAPKQVARTHKNNPVDLAPGHPSILPVEYVAPEVKQDR